MDNQKRHDPIGDRYFSATKSADRISNWFFYGAAVLSFAVLLIEKKNMEVVYNIVQGALVIAVIAVFVSGLTVRLYLTPRAEDMRRKDLLSKAFGVPLTHEQSTGYYNNDQTQPIRFMGVAYMENSFFSKAVLLRMAWHERIKGTIYIVVFLLAVLNRNTDLAYVSTAAIAIFSEQVLSRWLRLEWLRSRCETTYDSLYTLFQSSSTSAVLQAKALEAATFYETSKANGGIVLSESIFLDLNSTLSDEWKMVKKTLNL